MKDYIKTQLKKKFQNQAQFSTKELTVFMLEIMPMNNTKTFSWWIHYLTKEGFLQKKYRGCYTFSKLEDYVPPVSEKAKRAYNIVESLLPEKSEIAVFETIQATQILNIPATRHYIFFQIDKKHIETIFYELQNMDKRVFLKPSSKIIERYILPIKEAFLLYPSLKSTPYQKSGKYNCYSIESLLVNTYIYGLEFFKLTNTDIDHLFKCAYENYNVKTSTMIRYATRRNQKEEIENILERNALLG